MLPRGTLQYVTVLQTTGAILLNAIYSTAYARNSRRRIGKITSHGCKAAVGALASRI